MKLSLVVSLSVTDFSAVAMREGLAALDRVKALGYDAVEVAVRDPAEIDAGALVDRCAALDLPAVAIGTGQAYLADGLSLTDPDEGIRRKAIERLRSHIALAKRLNDCPGAPPGGVLVIVGLLRGRAAAGREQAEAWLREALAAVQPDLEEAATGIVLEAINRYETDFLNTLEETAAFVRTLGGDRFGVLADTFHMNIEDPSISVSLGAAADVLRHVHVADSNRQAPGLGHLDFPEVIWTLSDLGYAGYLSAEIVPLPDPDTAARQALDHLRHVVEIIRR